MRKIIMALVLMTVSLSSCHKLEFDYYTEGEADIYEAINRLQIDWPSGSVTVRYHDRNFVRFQEEGRGEIMAYYQTGHSLYLRYTRRIRLDFNPEPKNLYVYLPQGMLLDELDLDGSDVNVDIDADCLDVEIETTSGNVYYSNGIKAKEIEVETTTGNVVLELPSGKSFRLDYDTSFGKLIHSDFPLEGLNGFYIYGDGSPAMIDVETVTGDLELRYFKGA